MLGEYYENLPNSSNSDTNSVTRIMCQNSFRGTVSSNHITPPEENLEQEQTDDDREIEMLATSSESESDGSTASDESESDNIMTSSESETDDEATSSESETEGDTSSDESDSDEEMNTEMHGIPIEEILNHYREAYSWEPDIADAYHKINLLDHPEEAERIEWVTGLWHYDSINPINNDSPEERPFQFFNVEPSNEEPFDEEESEEEISPAYLGWYPRRKRRWKPLSIVDLNLAGRLMRSSNTYNTFQGSKYCKLMNRRP